MLAKAKKHAEDHVEPDLWFGRARAHAHIHVIQGDVERAAS